MNETNNNPVFIVGGTSYLAPADWLTNVTLFADAMDVMEILIIEYRGRTSMPSAADVRRMSRIASDAGLRFVIHLPEPRLAVEDEAERRRGVETLRRVFERCRGLNPDAYVLHIEPPSPVMPHRKRRDLIAAASDAVLAFTEGLDAPLCIENITAAQSWYRALIERTGADFCLDAGHLWIQDRDPVPFSAPFRGRTSMVHVHGVRNGKDHLPLIESDRERLLRLFRNLKRRETLVRVIIEVFKLSHFKPSTKLVRDVLNSLDKEDLKK